MTNSEAIYTLKKMKKRCTNSSDDSTIVRISKENQAIDIAIRLIEKEEKQHGI